MKGFLLASQSLSLQVSLVLLFPLNDNVYPPQKVSKKDYFLFSLSRSPLPVKASRPAPGCRGCPSQSRRQADATAPPKEGGAKSSSCAGENAGTARSGDRALCVGGIVSRVGRDAFIPPLVPHAVILRRPRRRRIPSAQGGYIKTARKYELCAGGEILRQGSG